MIIATGIFFPDIGGPATMLLNLIDGLIEQGIDVKVITYGDCSKIETKNSGLEIISIKKNTLFSKIKYFLKLFKLSKNTDLIYTTDTYSAGYFTYLIRKLTGKKYILRFTGDSAWENARSNGWLTDYIVDFQNIKYDHKIERLKKRRNKILFNASQIIVDSDFNKKLAEVIGVLPTKITIINNALLKKKNNELDNNKIEKIKTEIGQNFPIFMTACRLTTWKGVDQVIALFPEVLKAIGRAKFVILGEGPELENLRFLAQKLNLEKEVIFLGKVSQADIENYYRAANLFILNSQYEGLSNTLLEVMHAGVPVVASNCGGNPELIANNKEGVLIEYGNQEQLLNALIKILTDNNLANEFVQNAKQKVQQFNLDKMINKTIEVIKNL